MPGQDATVRAGRWKGSWTNGYWYWDYVFEDWLVNTADECNVEHEKPVSATAIWEFWTTGEKGFK